MHNLRGKEHPRKQKIKAHGCMSCHNPNCDQRHCPLCSQCNIVRRNRTEQMTDSRRAIMNRWANGEIGPDAAVDLLAALRDEESYDT